MRLDGRQAQQYFEKVPQKWDALYSHENKFKYRINKYLRKGLFLRHKLTFENCGNLSGLTVLDIGCGSGRYSIECVKRGAEKVVGLDFAPSMVEFSRAVAHEMGLDDKCEFVCDEFLSYAPTCNFDVVMALGFFDYIREPLAVLKKVASLRPRKFAASFPRFSLIWGLQRHIRYIWIRNCPIYYYSEAQLEGLYREAGFKQFRILPTKRGYFVIAGMD